MRFFFWILSWFGYSEYARLGGRKRSGEWRRVRNEYASKNPYCAVCGKRKIEVHHVVPFHVSPEMELLESNLISLCQGLGTYDHHLFFGHLGAWTSWNESVRIDSEHWREKIAKRP